MPVRTTRCREGGGSFVIGRGTALRNHLDISMRLDATTPWLMRYNEQESMSVGQLRWMDR